MPLLAECQAPFTAVLFLRVMGKATERDLANWYGNHDLISIKLERSHTLQKRFLNLEVRNLSNSLNLQRRFTLH